MSETERNEAVEVTEVSPEPTDTPSLLAELNIDEVVKERDEFKDIALRVQAEAIAAGDKAAADQLLQVSVVARDLVTADVWATAAFAEGPDCISRLERVKGVEALIVKLDGDLAATSGFIDLLAKGQ